MEADLAQRIAHRHRIAFFCQNLQQHAFRRRIEFVVHFFRLEFHDGFAALQRIALLLEPAYHIHFGGWQAAGLRHFKRGNDSDVSVWRASSM